MTGSATTRSTGDDNDTINGGVNDTIIDGGPGLDLLKGDAGADSLTGPPTTERRTMSTAAQTSIPARASGIDLERSSAGGVALRRSLGPDRA